MVSWPFAPHAPGAFDVIYADPPWSFATWSHRGQGRGASQHYEVMDIDAICALPVAALAAPDAALFIWVVQPMLPQALRVIEAWGFEFKTVAFVWVKQWRSLARAPRLFDAPEDIALGLGYHTRAQTEQCWLATRGKGYRKHSRAERQLLLAPLREHSRKPDEIAARIERLTGPDARRIELFARTQRPGWAAWGNQVETFAEGAA